MSLLYINEEAVQILKEIGEGIMAISHWEAMQT